MSTTTHPASMSPADAAAHAAASHVRPVPVDSDPAADEALRRVRASRIFSTPTTVETCQADYAASADVRRKLDATARRQHSAA
ncbi:hypothetical protein [Streptomyces sp. NPDC002994]|uniref:hypothetical protein n=1 Tax=Streptomyces sp. NPDC002994 TaxID=3154441 RepID=UPI0033AF95DE